MDAPVVPADNRLRVGDWTVEPDLNQLSTQGRAVKVEPKAMAVLLHLADRPGQVVGREALLSQVWPGVVVGDDSLTQVVIKLRKALGDDPDRPTYIQTVTKRGYRLVRRFCGRPGPLLPPFGDGRTGLAGSRVQPLSRCSSRQAFGGVPASKQEDFRQVLSPTLRNRRPSRSRPLRR